MKQAGRNGKPIEEPSLSSIKRKHEFSDDEEKDDDSHPDKKINTSDEVYDDIFDWLNFCYRKFPFEYSL